MEKIHIITATQIQFIVGLPIEELKQFCDIDDVKLGFWKHESSFTKARFVRQKTYIEEINR